MRLQESKIRGGYCRTRLGGSYVEIAGGYRLPLRIHQIVGTTQDVSLLNRDPISQIQVRKDYLDWAVRLADLTGGVAFLADRGADLPLGIHLPAVALIRWDIPITARDLYRVAYRMELADLRRSRLQ